MKEKYVYYVRIKWETWSGLRDQERHPWASDASAGIWGVRKKDIWGRSEMEWDVLSPRMSWRIDKIFSFFTKK